VARAILVSRVLNDGSSCQRAFPFREIGALGERRPSVFAGDARPGAVSAAARQALAPAGALLERELLSGARFDVGRADCRALTILPSIQYFKELR
jgi:hypothetical protein